MIINNIKCLYICNQDTFLAVSQVNWFYDIYTLFWNILNMFLIGIKQNNHRSKNV